DRRGAGRLADRVLAGHLPLLDILRTREAVASGIMLDIGANIGLTSVTRAILGDFDVIYAAEPAPDNFRCLVHNVLDNGLRGIVLPDCLAIGANTGTAALHLAKGIGSHAIRNDSDGVPVTIQTLDGWIRTLGIDADAVRF